MSSEEISNSNDGTSYNKDKPWLFQKGNNAAKGRSGKYNKQVHDLKRVIHEECTPEEMRKVIRSMLRKAKKGDLSAANMILDRLIGKPNQSVEVSSTGNDSNYKDLTTEELMRMINT